MFYFAFSLWCPKPKGSQITNAVVDLPVVEIVRDSETNSGEIGLKYEEDFEYRAPISPDNWNFEAYVATPFDESLIFNDKLVLVC